MPKKLLSALALAGVALSLVACSSGGNESSDSDCKAAAPGASSAKVDVSGGAADPKVDFPSPLTAKTTERTVIDAGKGDVAVDGSSVTVNILGYNGTSGEAIKELSSQDAKLQLDENLIPGLVSAIKCSSPGARVAAVIPPADAFQDQGSEAIGVGPKDSIVLVIDVAEVAKPVKALEKADGKDQAAPEGFPTVELAENGAPTVTIPATDPPTELQIAALKKGDGTEVTDGDTVTVHYTGVVYGTGETFDSSWDGEPATFPTDGVIPGFSKALVGQKVGSQVIAVIPPAEGYGDQVPQGATFGPTDTLVFVVDILATQ